MEKIDFAALIKQPENDQKIAENTLKQAKSRAMPDQFPTENEKVGHNNTMNNNDNNASARLARPARPKNEGGKIINDDSPAPEGVSAEEICAENLHPIAVCLLFCVARKIHSNNEEIFNELLKLETMTPMEQVKTWARYALENGIDPHRIIYPFIKSPGKGSDCMTCIHLDMISTNQPGISRKVYQWQCKKHHPILEAYYLRERVLVAPAECSDYQSV